MPSLEGAEDAVVSSSGMAAVAATLFAHLTSGDHLVAGDELFAITNVLLDEDFRGAGSMSLGWTRPMRLRSRRLSRQAPARVLRRDLDEPRLRIPDLDALAAIAHSHDPLFIADNTFLGPVLLRPLEHGADLVLHAATKYLSGHGDAVSGSSRVARP